METKKKNIVHIRNLITFAVIDNDFSECEMELIIRIANRLGVTYNDIKQILSDEIITFDKELTLIDKIEQLHDVVRVVKADGKVDSKEEELLEQFASYYNLSNNMYQPPIAIETSELKKDKSFQIFLNKFREMTERNLSEVLVDEELDILFPLYRKKLKLTPVEKSLYIFFLKFKEIESIRHLSDYKKWFSELYSLLPGAKSQSDRTIENIICPTGTCFYPNIARIKRKIQTVVPQNDNKLELHYFILSDKKTEKKYLPLENELITIQPLI